MCADIDGLSLRAAVRCGADDCQALGHLCRHITRPAVASERVQANAVVQVMLTLQVASRDGTKHLGISPPQFMQPHTDGQLCGIGFCECYVS